MKRLVACLPAACCLWLCACAAADDAAQVPAAATPGAAAQALPEPQPLQPQAPGVVERLLARLAGEETRRPVDADFLRWAQAHITPGFCERLLAALKTRPYDDGLFFELFGCTLTVLHDLYRNLPATADDLRLLETGGPVTLAFTGDVNLADDWYAMQALRAMPGGLQEAIDPGLMARLQGADILLVNNEFCFSDGGAPLAKRYTFRAATANVALLHQMGVDVVSLANNHVFDYGEAAFYDTLATLDDAGIPHVGAGRDEAEAARPYYFIAGGMKFGYVAASCAVETPAAGPNAPGALACYEPERFLQAVAEAREAADVVVAYPHWGTENTTRLDARQLALGEALVAAGADVVVGAHPHCLQGVDWYDGRPVVYSLGNFWFNTRTTDTALLEVTVHAPGQLALRLVPCLQAGGVTRLLEGEAAQRVLAHVESISTGTVIDAGGGLAPAGDGGAA